MEISPERAKYLAEWDKIRLLEEFDTDFNRPAKLNEHGHLVFSGRTFVFEDGTGGVKPGQLVYIGTGGGVSEGTPGFIGMVIDVAPEVHSFTPTGRRWADHYQLAKAKPIQWQEENGFS